MYPLSRIIIVIVQEVHTPDFIIASKSNAIKKVGSLKSISEKEYAIFQVPIKSLLEISNGSNLIEFTKQKMQYDKYNKLK
jgi:hypothetical protein